MKILCVTN